MDSFWFCGEEQEHTARNATLTRMGWLANLIGGLARLGELTAKREWTGGKGFSAG
jgi:hypothetical protein